MIDISTSHDRLRPLPLGAVDLEHGEALHRRELTRTYLHEFRQRDLIQNHLIEAGRLQINEPPFDLLGGWESPSSMVRGHFGAHWMAAASTLWATTGDTQLKGTLDAVVAELARCQADNGGEWIAPIPEKYLHWLRRGKPVWAPTYVAHKTLMGLHDAFVLTGNEQALEIIVNAAKWFTRFTDDMSRDALDDFLDWETGGIQEIWADLYGITKEQDHLDLVHRFDRRRLIDRLLAGEDPLTNQHANQTVPEILSAARAFEVTGDTRWRDAVEAYWRCAVTDRGTFATGGQTFGEYWTPPFEFAARLGPTNQEHCVVFNMMRLAERLLRWTGDPQYADYLERNRVNGVYAQQHPETGRVAYYLPLHAGATKSWATSRESFWCCVSTQVQAGTRLGLTTWYEDDDGLVVADYLPTTARWTNAGVPVTLALKTDEDPPEPGRADFDHGLPDHRPNQLEVRIQVDADAPTDFDLRLRIPWWTAGPARLTIDDEAVACDSEPGRFVTVRRTWSHQRIRLVLPSALTTEPIPDQPGTVAFMDGPRVLAGLVGERRRLHGDVTDPLTILEPAAELELGIWHPRWSTHGQAADFDLIPLGNVIDQPYTVYFPVVADDG